MATPNQQTPQQQQQRFERPPRAQQAGEFETDGLIIVLYGVGGIGKTTTALACPLRPKYVFRCGNGAFPPGTELEVINNAGELKTSAVWFRANAHPYKVLLLDRADHLYTEAFNVGTQDARTEGRKAQGPFLDAIWEFMRIPGAIKIICMNERERVDDKTGKRIISMKLSPAAWKKIEDVADVVARVTNSTGSPDGSVLTVQRVDGGAQYVQAKSNLPQLTNGMKLSDLWDRLGLKAEYGPNDPYDLKRAWREAVGPDGKLLFAHTALLRREMAVLGINKEPAPNDVKGWKAVIEAVVKSAAERQQQLVQATVEANAKRQQQAQQAAPTTARQSA